jgi:hypothetical protein
MVRHNVVRAHPILRAIIERDVIATPLLIEQGTRCAVEAYRDAGAGGRGFWRMRDDGYDPPGTKYELVMVEVERDQSPFR